MTIEEALKQKFTDNDIAIRHFGDLLAAYQKSELAPPHLEQELSASLNEGDGHKFYSCVWEAMLFRHFSQLGLEFSNDHIRKCGQEGPDFGIKIENHTLWIEAIAITPGENFPEGWLTEGLGIAKSIPHEAILLRWTSALSDKNKKVKEYISKNIISENDPVVIAINSSQLSWFPSEDVGISQLPWAAESVFPLGPLAIQGNKLSHSPRYSISKKNNKNAVPTDNFLNPDFKNISAIIGCSRIDMLRNELIFSLVHNNMAENKCPRGSLKATNEYEVSENDDYYLLTKTV